MQSSKKARPIKRQRSTSRSPSPSPREPLPTWTGSSRKKRATSGDDPITRTQRHIPAFLNKLYSMVDDPSTNELIRWSPEGNSFIVEQHELFSKTVLPRFYKHNTFSSFVRQLNMYDFHKVPHLQQGVLLVDNEHELWEFTHPNFQRNRHELLHSVVRKRIRNNNDQQQQQLPSQQPSPLPTPSLEQSQQLLLGQQFASPSASSAMEPPRLNALGDTSMQLEYVRLGSLVKDISTIRQHQHAISTDLQHLHNDNEILWRETLLAREKHQRHQQVIERILLFLTSVFSNDGKQVDAAKHPRYMFQNQDDQITGPQAGHMDSIAGPPGRLIEEAVKLAGISTTSLHERLLDHDVDSPGGKLGGSPSLDVPDRQTPMYHQHHHQHQQQHPAAATLQQPPYQQHQHQQQNSQDQGQGQDKGKIGMYGKRVTDPSLLTLVLNDLYSIRDTFASISSNPHGMKSSAMKPSSSRSEQTILPSEYHHDPQLHPNQHHYHHPTHHQQQGHLPTTGRSNMTAFSPNDGYDSGGGGGMDRTAATATTALYTSSASNNNNNNNNNTADTAMAPTGTNPLLGFPNLHTTTTTPSALSGLTAGECGGNETGDITRIVGLAESLHTATRSAEAISQDIDDLQISIESLAATMGLDTEGMEGFDGYIDEFTDNYSNMISLATKNDKMQLFQLADDSNTHDNSHPRQDAPQTNTDTNCIDQKFTDIPPHTAPNGA